MQVKDVMTKAVKSCSRETSLSDVGLIMVSGNCGIVPVVNGRKKVVGVVTDRDLLLNLVKSDARPSEIQVGEIMGAKVYTCRPESSLNEVLKTMRERKVRRLPVTDGDGTLKGIVSLDDIVLESHETDKALEEGPSYDEVVDAFKDICAHQIVFGTRSEA